MDGELQSGNQQSGSDGLDGLISSLSITSPNRVLPADQNASHPPAGSTLTEHSSSTQPFSTDAMSVAESWLTPPSMFGRAESVSPSSQVRGSPRAEAVRRPSALSTPGHRKRASKVEKEVDNVDTPTVLEAARASTPTRLTRLFAATSSAGPSRQSSYNMNSEPYTRASAEEVSLPEHLFNRGFLRGRHSDVVVHAFGKSYPLHRLILDRAPFFSSALSEPWFESSSKDISLHPEEIDSNITKNAFELTLKRLYGHGSGTEEDDEATGIFATACWLEMGELINLSVDSLLRQMQPSRLSRLIRLVSNNYYGGPGERLLSSAKAMLFREGWEMPVKYWDGISGELARDIIGGDGFYVEDEFQRWLFARKLLNRRLKQSLRHTERSKSSAADGTSNISLGTSHPTSQGSDISGKASPYEHQDIAPLKRLLETGIHYVHLSFEQLQYVQLQRDVLGNGIISADTASKALWMSMELRQLVTNASSQALELGLKRSVPANTTGRNEVQRVQRTNSDDSGDSNLSSSEWVEIVKGWSEPSLDVWNPGEGPRKHWIPTADFTSVYGDTPDDQTTSAMAPMHRLSKGDRSQTNADGSTILSGTQTLGVPVCGRAPTNKPTEGPEIKFEAANTPEIPYSLFPPYRFSVSFPSARLLKEKRRVYSRTVWYAGSTWNIYIQKVRSSKSVQLGVYLHRAKDREKEEYAYLTSSSRGTVDERIGHLEREMLLQRTERHSGQRQQDDEHGDESSSGGDNTTNANVTGTQDISSTGPLYIGYTGRPRRPGRDASGLRLASNVGPHGIDSESDENVTGRSFAADGNNDVNEEGDNKTQARVLRYPTLPAYTDTRPTIMTYFKIYSPSKAGRMLSIYESAPDGFNFSQSWGWKSSTLILDDGDGLDDDDEKDGTQARRRRDDRLRFSVVLGVV